METINETKTWKQRVKEIAEKYNWKFDILEDGKVRLDISLKLNDGTIRYQYIYLASVYEGKRIYMSSRIGLYKPMLLYPMIKRLSSLCCYSFLGVMDDRYNGEPSETFVLQATPDSDISDELLFKIIFEVGNLADFMEKTFYGVDNV